jgi:hypothetical protein
VCGATALADELQPDELFVDAKPGIAEQWAELAGGKKWSMTADRDHAPELL